MYTPKSFREENLDRIYEFVRAHNFGLLISQHEGTPQITHAPFMLKQTDDTQQPILQTHVARANPHWQYLSADTPIVCVFQGAHAYISPSLYVNPLAVPTWNYSAVHMTGKPRLVTDETALTDLLMEITYLHETQAQSTWSLDYAREYLEQRLAAVVGIEIVVEKIEGKFKFNQNKAREDQESVLAYFAKQEDANSQAIVEIMQRNLNATSD